MREASHVCQCLPALGVISKKTALLWVTSVALCQELIRFKSIAVNHLRNEYLLVSLLKLCGRKE